MTVPVTTIDAPASTADFAMSGVFIPPPTIIGIFIALFTAFIIEVETGSFAPVSYTHLTLPTKRIV